MTLATIIAAVALTVAIGNLTYVIGREVAYSWRTRR